MKNIVMQGWPQPRRWTFLASRDYLALDGVKMGDAEGTIVFAFKMSLWEKVLALVIGKIYLSVQTFYGPLQPLRLDVVKPEFIEENLKSLKEERGI